MGNVNGEDASAGFQTPFSSADEDLAVLLARRTPKRRSRTTTALVLVLVFLLGILIGVAIGRGAAAARPQASDVGIAGIR